MNRQPLTDKQKAILDFVSDEIEERSRSPTIREIAARFSLKSTRTVFDHLQALQRKGYVKLSREHRSMEVVGGGSRKGAGFPLLGRTAAGHPVMADELPGERIDLNEMLDSGKETFLLEVDGLSMLGAGIHDGDYVVVRKQGTAREGEIVVARVDGETTVKRLKKQGRELLLLPENPAFQPIPFSAAASAEILGKVVGVVRKL